MEKDIIKSLKDQYAKIFAQTNEDENEVAGIGEEEMVKKVGELEKESEQVLD